MNLATFFALSISAAAGVAAAAPYSAADAPGKDGLVAVQSRMLDEVLVRPNVDLASYRKIIVDPPQAALRKNWLKDINSQRDVTRWLSSEDAQKITDEAAAALQATVTESFKTQGYEIGKAPGEGGVLRLTASVTDLYVNAPYAPYPGLQVAFVRDTGEATIRLDVRDAATGTLLARCADSSTAREIRLINRANGVTNQFWFEALFRQWATNCAKEFDRARTETAQARP